ncbi:MAG: hypothetical protein EAZ85_10165 [Bacteroidetes bacterium]|nr:MAG: hypothetical protein EAZ85_10165 [Bacteroidota bacterium]TAG91703.1 MAG: hypothetical protein EAZ20_03095 [Bacteroidota bacterium]
MKKYFIFLGFYYLSSLLQAQYSFEYKNFQKLEHLSLESNAKKETNCVVLTSDEISQKGGLWHTKQKINIKNGFITEFSFRIHKNGISWNEPNLSGADGIAFVIHNNSQATDQGEIGGGMGYEKIPNCVAVEFDTWANEQENSNHIAIQTKGKYPNTAQPEGTIAKNENLPVLLKNGEIHQATIEYKDKKIVIFLNKIKVLEKEIDLSKTISLEDNEKAWIGFTASTGAAFSQHEIHSWSFKEYIPPIIVVEKPKTLENRTIVGKNKIKVKSRKISLEIWDQGIEDGDIISLNLNNQWILENYTIKKRKKIIEITLEGKENYLVLHALNLGSSPPNTVALTIKDSKKTHKTLLNSNMKASDSIEIMYDGE